MTTDTTTPTPRSQTAKIRLPKAIIAKVGNTFKGVLEVVPVDACEQLERELVEARAKPPGDSGPTLAGAGSATKWATRGDWVETKLSTGTHFRFQARTLQLCAYANELIASGRWQVSPNAQPITDRRGATGQEASR